MFRIWFERTLPQRYFALLEGVAEILGAATETPETPFAAISEAEAIIAGGRLTYDGALMDRAPGLRVISRTGIGLDNVSIDDATSRGIAVCNAPDAPTVSTAEHAVALMFAVARQLRWCEESLLRGGKPDYFNQFQGLELCGATLGLVGFGRIGGHVARIAAGLGMSRIAFDPFIPRERAAELGVELVPFLEVLLSRSDVVSLHLPLTEETQNLIDAKRLAHMKPGAILINAARGGLVDETALLEALESGRLRGAGLDAFSTEPPPPDHPLLRRQDVVATPHIGGASEASKERLWRTALEQALQVLKGEKPAHLVNPEVWPLG